MRAWLCLLWGVLMLTAAHAEEVVLTLSTREVAITTNYDGATLTAFGLIERDAATIARSGGYDIVVQVEGPRGTIVLHRKGAFGPLWLTQKRQIFEDTPLFLALLSSRPLSLISDEDVRARLGLGLHYRMGKQPAPLDPGFVSALQRLRREQGALLEDDKAVSMIRPNVFAARLALPANAPPGFYILRASVLSEGVPLKTAEAGFIVRKIGFDAYLTTNARQNPWRYGLMALLLTALVGGLGHFLFRRD